MIIEEKTSRREFVLSVARSMMGAARTAPKGKGFDHLEIKTITGDEVAALAKNMHVYAEELNRMFFHRDAENIAVSDAVVLIGTRIASIGLDCGWCGFATCAKKNEQPTVPCAFNTNDLGIAVGSACSVAADHRVDSRVMYSAGLSAMKMGLIKESGFTLAIPISCTSKSPFFDRVSTRPPVEPKK